MARNSIIRRRPYSLAPYARMAGTMYKAGGIRAGYQLGKRMMSSFRNRNTEARSNPTATITQSPTTFQHDTRTTYTRRKAPKRVVRRARRQAQQFQKNLSQVLGLKSYVNNTYSGITFTAGNQGFLDIPFVNAYTMGSLFALFGTDGTPTTAFSTFTNDTQNNEIMVSRYRAEVEFKNPGTSLIYLDLYYYYPRKDTQYNASDAIQQGATSTSQNGVTFNGTTPSNGVLATGMGVTPFHFAAFTENFVVYKTRRIMLQASQSCSISQKSGRIGNQSNRDWVGMNLRRNISTGVIVIASGEVSSTSTAAGNINIHKQEWVSVYKNGGQGARAITALQLQS